jgi:hypothetical protein
VLAAEAQFASATKGIWFWSKRGFFKTIGVFFLEHEGRALELKGALLLKLVRNVFGMLRVFALKQAWRYSNVKEACFRTKGWWAIRAMVNPSRSAFKGGRLTVLNENIILCIYMLTDGIGCNKLVDACCQNRCSCICNAMLPLTCVYMRKQKVWPVT